MRLSRLGRQLGINDVASVYFSEWLQQSRYTRSDVLSEKSIEQVRAVTSEKLASPVSDIAALRFDITS